VIGAWLWQKQEEQQSLSLVLGGTKNSLVPVSTGFLERIPPDNRWTKMRQTSQEPLNILVVDDDPACRKLMQLAIRGSSIDCTGAETAESVEQTLEWLRARRFDVVLLDLNLPGSYGRQTVEMVARAQPTAAIVVVSGLDGDDLDALNITDDVHGHLNKGKFDVSVLEKTITEAVEKKADSSESNGHGVNIDKA